jgi:hypothetical protein
MPPGWWAYRAGVLVKDGTPEEISPEQMAPQPLVETTQMLAVGKFPQLPIWFSPEMDGSDCCRMVRWAGPLVQSP